ncbi:hypothetical protein [Croceivirga sp. JEA036]|uniref:hypothetical protein n=1 Tax=Croceivirga sp. JEA036 TaxID=2721162 RepID=UPI00143A40B4|nr:hypothetical protein [Croceivirga sp. JEA036]NJB37878.1 hypothetical protein [Croceivirga sp. JEA036]
MMKTKYAMTICLLAFSIFGNLLAQNEQDFTPPSINDEKEIPVVKEELPIPMEGENFTVRYFSGVTDGEESRIAIKSLGYILRNTMVHVFTENGDELDVKIVKKGWDDIQRQGSTKNGEFKSVFRTALEFGVVISAAEKGIPFIVAISAGPELFPTSNLFVDISTKQPTMNDSDSQTIESDKTTSIFTTKSLAFILIALAIIIIGLLFFIIFRKNRNTLSIFLMFFSLCSLHAGKVLPHGNSLNNYRQTPQMQELINRSNKKIREAIEDEYDKDKKDEEDLLSEEDIEFEPELSPAGQPSLPSSCIATANASEGGSMDGDFEQNKKDGSQDDKYKEGSKSENAFSEDGIDYDSENSSSSNQRENSGGTEMISSSNYEAKEPNNENTFTGESSSETYRRLPKYDENGNLKNSGDYPDAPVKYDPNWVPEENVFVESEGSTGSYRRLPKYDEYGNLKNPGDFPDAPIKYDPNWEPPENPFTGESSSGDYRRLPKYDENGNLKNPGDYPDAPSTYNPNWIPEENVFIESNGSSGTYTRMPKYDKDGHLLDYGDYPHAPKQIDPERVDDQEYIMNEIEANIDEPKEGENTNSSEGSQEEENRPGQNNPSEMDSGRRQTSNNSNDRKREGCECLKKAYKELHKRRYSLEKLSKIGKYNKKVTDFGLSFGDNFSSSSGVGSLAWKNKRIKIMKSMKKFDQSYKDKHEQITKLLYKNLMEINKCERMLGEDNWYNKYGFIYYEFMKTRYATYK